MSTEITSKTELQSISGDLSNSINTLKSDFDSMKSTLNSAEDYDGINVSGPAKILISNIENVITDFDTAVANITGYVAALNQFDVDDFDDITLTEIIKNIEAEEKKEEENKVVTLDNKDTTKTETQNNGTWVNLSTSNSGNYSGNNHSGGSSYSGGSNYSGGSSYSGGSNNSGSNLGYIVNLGNSGGSNSSWNPSEKVGDSVITTTMVVTPSGKISSNGRTQRSAKKSFTIKPGIKDDPNLDITKYKDNVAMGFKVTTGNLTYDLCEEDVELLCAIVSAESDKSYDDALAVISTILNRCETSNWINSHGRDPIAQATAPNQYVVYQHGSYEKYMNGKAPETVVQAVKDALSGVRNHKYTSFRSNGTTNYSSNMITSTGNRYL